MMLIIDEKRKKDAWCAGPQPFSSLRRVQVGLLRVQGLWTFGVGHRELGLGRAGALEP